MSKFSIIVPIYNEETSIQRCLDSIFNQTYGDYEVIIVTDGKYNKSILKYREKFSDKIKFMHIKKTKNMSIYEKTLHKVSGEYLLFIDCNDYIGKNLLKILNSKLKDYPDIVRFQVKEMQNAKVCMYRELPFETVRGLTAFKKFEKYHYFDNIQLYLYKKEFIDKFYKKYSKYVNDNFFALGSFLVSQAEKVKSIGYVGYVIEKDKNKITNSPMELLQQYKIFSKYLVNCKTDNLTMWKSYVANLLIQKIVDLKAKKYKEYLKSLHENGIFNLVKQTGVEKWLICNYPKMYFKLKKEDND